MYLPTFIFLKLKLSNAFMSCYYKLSYVHVNIFIYVLLNQVLIQVILLYIASSSMISLKYVVNYVLFFYCN